MSIKMIILGVLLSMATMAEAGRSPLSFVLSIEDNDNLGNADVNLDQREDVVTELHLAYRDSALLNRKTAFFYGADLGQSLHNDFDLLDTLSLELEFGLRYKSQNTFAAPSYSIRVQIARADAEVDIRDIDYWRVDFNLDKRVTDRVRLRLGFEGYAQEARIDPNNSEVFSLDRQRIYGNLDYRVSRQQILYFTYSLMDGEVITVADDARLGSGLPRIHDSAFGPRSESRLYAYRVDADTQIVNLGYNIGINRQQALDITYQYIDSDAENNISYQTNKINLAYLLRF